MPSASAISLMRRIALGAANILHKLSIFSQIQCSVQAAWDSAAQPLQENAAVSFRFNFGAHRTAIFGQRRLNGTVYDRR